MIKVSVVVPVYNTSKYLDRCLNSLVNQTLDDIQIIIVNDGSLDNSNVIIHKYLKEYGNSKIKVIYNDNNMGTGYSRNIGLSCANGEYIGFVDSDDYVDYNYFEVMYNKAVNSNYPDIVRCDIDSRLMGLPNLFSTKNPIGDVDIDNIDKRKHYILNEYNSCCNKIFKREFVENEKFIENNKYEDYSFTLPLLVKTSNIVGCNNTKYHYLMNIHGSMMNGVLKVNKNILDIFDASDYILDKSIRYSDYELLSSTLNDIFTINSYKRVRDLFFTPMDTADKIIIMSNIVNLIDIKYGKLEDNKLYQELKDNIKYKYLCNYIEGLISDSIRRNDNEKIAKAHIKCILKNY